MQVSSIRVNATISDDSHLVAALIPPGSRLPYAYAVLTIDELEIFAHDPQSLRRIAKAANGLADRLEEFVAEDKGGAA